MPKNKRTLIVCMADTHGGYKLGLCNPKTPLVDEHGKEWNPKLMHHQRLLWRDYTRGIEQVMELAGRDPVILIHAGDVTHGSRFPDTHLISPSASDQADIAVWNFMPWMEHKNVQSLLVLSGTQVHEPAGRSVTNLLSLMTEKRIVYEHHALARVAGLTLDVAHHGASKGRRKWLEGNELRYYVRSLMFEEILAGKAPPDVLLRGHYHGYVHETVRVRSDGRGHQTDAFVLPGYSGMDLYARKVTRSKHILGYGLLVLEVLDGVLYRVHDGPEFIHSIDLRKEVVL